ncbi:MAG: YceD family protein [Zoogloeaceae bacterium]|jgi:uncharacterized protein|nr:YceD family protein [Zoogloeaceae bacterium]
MSPALLIDAYRFSHEHRRLEGVLPILELTRLADFLSEAEGEISWRLSGLSGERGQPRLRLAVTGVLSLRCQRCLDTVVETLAIDALLELVSGDAALAREELENDCLDFLPMTGRMLDVKALVEDEILLALPVAPRHEECALPLEAYAANGKPRPFAALAGFKGGHG